jgi:hypothetical protein
VILPALLTAFVSSRDGRAQSIERTQALAAMTEMKEILRNVRELGWNTFISYQTYPPTPYHPALRANGSWELQPNTELISTASGMTRQIIMNNACRNSSGTLVDCSSPGAITDASTKLVQLSVAWSKPRPNAIISNIYMTRYLDNLLFSHTTLNDFNTNSVKTDTAVITSTPQPIPTPGDAQIQLSGGAPRTADDWCAPNLTQSSLAITQSISTSTQSVMAAAEGKIAMVMSTGNSLLNIPVTTTYVPTASIAGGANPPQKNAIFTDGRYIFVTGTTQGNPPGLPNGTYGALIYDTQTYTGTAPNQSYSPIGGIANGQQGTAIYADGTYVYLVGANTLYVYNAGSGANLYKGSLSQVRTINLANNNVTRMVVKNGYAFVFMSSNYPQAQMINVSTGQVIRSYGINNLTGMIDGFMSNDTNYIYILSQKVDSTHPNINVFDTTDKTYNAALTQVSTAIASYNTMNYPTAGSNAMNPSSILVFTEPTKTYAIIGGSGGSENYIVLRWPNGVPPSSLTRCGGTTVPGNVIRMATVKQSNGDAYAYVMTGDSGKQLKIIAGGEGGGTIGGYAMSSSLGHVPAFESQPVDVKDLTGVTDPITFNRFTVNYTLPTSTSIQAQVAVADYPTGCTVNCCQSATYDYRGPTSTSDFYTAAVGSTTLSGAVPFLATGSYVNPGHCLRYKLYLDTTDISKTPVVSDFSVNYSP